MGDTQPAVDWDAMPPILTAAQVAAIAGVRPAQVLRWANSGQLRGVKVGRHWRFAKSVVQEGTRPPGAGSDAGGAGAD